MDNLFILSLTILLPFIFIFIFLHSTILNKHSKLPPGPNPWPIIGNIHLLGPKPHHSLSKLSKIYGPIMSLKLGSITTVVVSSPEITKLIFTKHDAAFSGRHIPDAATVANHHHHSLIFLPVSPKWRTFRKISAVHLFTPQKLDSTQTLRRNNIDQLVAFLRNCCDNRIPVDIGNASFITSLNLLSNTFFSSDLSAYDSKHSSEFKEIVSCLSEELAKPNLSDFFPVIRRFDLQGIKSRNLVHFKRMWRVFEEIIEERLSLRSCKELKDDVLDTLLHLVDEDELTLDDVINVIMDLFSAGTESTYITVEWAMTELLRHPEKMVKVQNEIRQTIKKKQTVQESDFPKLPYIQAIVKETLRLHPPTPFLVPHKAEEEVHLCKYDVPQNAQIWVNIWSIGRDPDVWSNPESFLPERFLERDIDIKGQNFELIPFGSGRRICPGMPLGYRMVHLLLATLLHTFDWTLPDGMNSYDIGVEEKFGLTLQKAQPLHVVPHIW